MFLGSIVEPCYIQNSVITNRVIKGLLCMQKCLNTHVCLTIARIAMYAKIFSKVKIRLRNGNIFHHVNTPMLFRPHHHSYMSHVLRKPAFCICENKDTNQLRGNREADQRLCFRYIDSTIPLLPKSKISSL